MEPGTPARTRGPWIVWAVAIVLLVATMALSVLNGSLSEDPFFIPVAVLMIVGYSTVGAVLASRSPGNPIGRLMLAIGVAFVLTGLSDEYMRHAFLTSPGTLPGGAFAGLLSETMWLPMIASASLLVALFPDGRPPGPRWRFLPIAIAAGVAVFLVGQLTTSSPMTDIGLSVPIDPPTGVDAFGDVPDVLSAIGTFTVLLGLLPSLAALVVRFRRSRGEERQQLRWLVAVVVLIAGLILLQIALVNLLGRPFEESLFAGGLFLTTFAVLGVGIPVAMGVAVLRYHLYDLDVVVKKTVVFGILVVLTMAVSLATLLAVSSPLTDLAPDETQAVGITMFAVGLSVWPLWRLARRIADRVVYGGRATPYEVLTRFSSRVGETYATDDVLPRMAQLLGEATGAAVARVWVRVGDELRPAASWPADAPGPAATRLPRGAPIGALGHATAEVRHGGEVLGALSIDLPANDPIGPAKERIVRDLAAQAGLVLRNVRLIEELRESRRRIVAAQDDRAKALERNIHDGAQQQLVALTVKARLAGTFATKDAERTQAMLAEIQRDLTDALENLRDLARGIYPPLLADKGLAAAVEAQARKSPIPVTVDAGIGRYAPEIESAVYFSVLEALNNVAKYAGASSASIVLVQDRDGLAFTVADDGIGFDPTATSYGTGLQGIADRLDAIGGRLEVLSAPGGGTTVQGRIEGVASPAGPGAVVHPAPSAPEHGAVAPVEVRP